MFIYYCDIFHSCGPYRTKFEMANIKKLGNTFTLCAPKKTSGGSCNKPLLEISIVTVVSNYFQKSERF